MPVSYTHLLVTYEDFTDGTVYRFLTDIFSFEALTIAELYSCLLYTSLLVDHTLDGTMGLVLNKSLPLYLNDVLKDFKDEIGRAHV